MVVVAILVTVIVVLAPFAILLTYETRRNHNGPLRRRIRIRNRYRNRFRPRLYNYRKP